MTAPVPTPGRTALNILHSVEDDIRTLVALTQAVRLLGASGVDTLVPGEVVYEIGRLIEEAAERIQAAWHEAWVALREQ